ncbi:SDR family oxidoreductase [Acidothermaceae bacterium B102]|nr:SDR family oxidoreductase [Acidothermaceae bacterium B102]
MLLTGATGYIGGRLAPVLLEQGHQVVCLTRDEDRLRDVPWRDQVEVVEGDIRDEAAVRRAFEGVDAAYFLVHALGTGKSFADRDRRAAEVVAKAAAAVELKRLVYLGGLIPQGVELSDHLKSRAEVGQILLASGVPTVELRAAVILGSGSASFEMLRYLTERLPAMITPKWVANRVQPIAIRDVVFYLAACLELPSDVSRSFDIGGPDVLTYRDMMQRYAEVAGLTRRIIVPVPVLTPRLSSHWVGVVTPVPSSIARPLVESLRNEVVAGDHDIAAYIADPLEGLLPFDESVRLALQRVRDHDVTTRWSSAAWPDAPSDPLPSDPDWAGGSLYVDERETVVRASRDQLWAVIEGIGGENGWYSWPLAWAVRGWMDRFVGGVGLRRGRRDPRRLYVGESLDFWRVEAMDRGRMLRLRAEMKVPGLAWLELSIEPDTGPAGTVTFHQRAIFHPRGLLGHVYWRAIAPFHGAVFGGMLRNIATQAERTDDVRAPVDTTAG